MSFRWEKKSRPPVTASRSACGPDCITSALSLVVPSTRHTSSEFSRLANVSSGLLGENGLLGYAPFTGA
jgi:hypothetical protein